MQRKDTGWDITQVCTLRCSLVTCSLHLAVSQVNYRSIRGCGGECIARLLPAHTTTGACKPPEDTIYVGMDEVVRRYVLEATDQERNTFLRRDVRTHYIGPPACRIGGPECALGCNKVKKA